MKDAFLCNSFGIGRTYNGKLPLLRIDYILRQRILKFRNLLFWIIIALTTSLFTWNAV